MKPLTYKFLDEPGTDVTLDDIPDYVHDEFVKRFIQTLTGEATEDQFLSLKGFNDLYASASDKVDDAHQAVLQALKDIGRLLNWYYDLRLLDIEIVTGNIEERVPIPRSNVLYLQRYSVKDTTWSIWFFDNREWCSVCDERTLERLCVKISEIDDYERMLQDVVFDHLSDEETKVLMDEIIENVMSDIMKEEAQ